MTRLLEVPPSDMVFLLSFFSAIDRSSNKGPKGPGVLESVEVLVLPGSRILDFFFTGLALVSPVGAVLIISGGFGSRGGASEASNFALADNCGSDAFLIFMSENLRCLAFSVWMGGGRGRSTAGAGGVSLLRLEMWRLEGVGAVDTGERELAKDASLGICALVLASAMLGLTGLAKNISLRRRCCTSSTLESPRRLEVLNMAKALD